MTTPRHGPRRHAPLHARGITDRVEHPALAITAGVVAIVVVSAYGFALRGLPAAQSLDLRIDQALSRAHVPILETLAAGIYKVFSPVEAIILTLVLGALVWLIGRNLRAAVTFVAVVGITWVPSDILKLLVDRARPDPALLAHPFLPEPTDPSYPSGHAVFIASLAMAFIFLARRSSKQPLVIFVATVVALVLISALPYLGVHYLSDVVASIIWSIGVAPLVLMLWNRIVIPLTYRRADRIR